MKGKLVNKKVVNSIGIGILAFVTASAPVLEVCAAEGEGGTNVGILPQVEENGTVENVERSNPTSLETAFGNANAALDKAKEPTADSGEGSSVEVKPEIEDSIVKSQESVKALESKDGVAR